MSTFHRIVLALAGSLNNNGISSLAPQGNRALRNETNALASAFAERQAQPLAKTPPIPNRIGKGIGKFWILILLATATALTTIPIEQIEAASQLTPEQIENRRQSMLRLARTLRSSRTNQVSATPRRSIPISPSSRVRTTPAPRLTIPAAIPPPLLAPAAPVIKKGAIIAGTWLVAVALEWGVQGLLDKLAKIEDEKATATVHGARWLSNEYSYKCSVPSGLNSWTNFTITANMGDEDILSSASGWWGNWKNRAMTQSEAINHLKRRIASITASTWTAIVPPTPSKHAQTMFFEVKARSDEYPRELAKTFALYRANFPNITFTKCNESIKKWKVGSFGMFSDFDDPTPILEVLGTADAIDSDANYYEATATWDYRELQPNGTWGEWKSTKYKFSRSNAEPDGIKSWEDHHFDDDFCDDNQEITDPAIYEGIERFISKRPVMERYRRRGQMRRGGEYGWRRVGWEPVVVQQYQDLTGN